MDEKTLVSAVLAGDQGAQEAFDQAFRKRLFATAVHFLGSQDAEAEDMVQETLFLAHRKLEEFQFRSGLYLWLNHICVNFCLKRLQRRYKTLVAQEDELEALSHPQALSLERRRLEKDEAGRAAAAVAQAIQSLQDGCRQVLELRHQQGLSYAGIGKALKLPLGTVMSRLARCRERLKEALRAWEGLP